MRWRPTTKAQRVARKLAGYHARYGYTYYRWFAWRPVKLQTTGERMWLEMLERTDEFFTDSARIFMSRFYPSGFFEEQRRRNNLPDTL